ncbi:ATP-binding protein [Nostoc spongiaeforme]|nr:ATP-binding protein [Nostoc spongiaeforme]
MNILVNALDALEERDQKCSLEQIQSKSSNICIQISVSDTQHIVIRFIDNMPGIPENLLKRLFDSLTPDRNTHWCSNNWIRHNPTF